MALWTLHLVFEGEHIFLKKKKKVETQTWHVFQPQTASFVA